MSDLAATVACAVAMASNKDKTVIFTYDLTWIILLPVIGALAVLATPKSIARWLALLFTAATFVLSILIFFRIVANGYNFGDLNNLADSVQMPWIISGRRGTIQN